MMYRVLICHFVFIPWLAQMGGQIGRVELHVQVFYVSWFLMGLIASSLLNGA
jgi:hypothetical protein